MIERREGPWSPQSGAAYHLVTHDPEAALTDGARTVAVSEYAADGTFIVRTVVEFDARAKWVAAEGGGFYGGVSRRYDDQGQLLDESRVWVSA